MIFDPPHPKPRINQQEEKKEVNKQENKSKTSKLAVKYLQKIKFNFIQL